MRIVVASVDRGLEREGLHPSRASATQATGSTERSSALRVRRAAGDARRSCTGRSIAFVIVVLLTPAVGGMARLLGVGRPAGRAAPQPAADPAARRARDLPRDPRSGALAFLDLSGESRGVLLGAAVATRRRRDRRLPRALRPSAKLAGQIRRRGDPVRVRRLDRPLHAPVPRACRHLRRGSACRSRWCSIVAVMNMVNFLDGLDGLAAGVCGSPA
mgnify:CR=1 FL=1